MEIEYTEVYKNEITVSFDGIIEKRNGQQIFDRGNKIQIMFKNTQILRSYMLNKSLVEYVNLHGKLLMVNRKIKSKLPLYKFWNRKNNLHCAVHVTRIT